MDEQMHRRKKVLLKRALRTSWEGVTRFRTGGSNVRLCDDDDRYLRVVITVPTHTDSSECTLFKSGGPTESNDSFICHYYITSNWAKGRTTRFRFAECQDFFFRLIRFYSPSSYPTDIEVLAFASGATSYYPAALLFLFHTMYVFPNKLTSAQARRLHVPLISYPSLISWAFLMAHCKAAAVIIFSDGRSNLHLSARGQQGWYLMAIYINMVLSIAKRLTSYSTFFTR
jgi:hypothetical protein